MVIRLKRSPFWKDARRKSLQPSFGAINFLNFRHSGNRLLVDRGRDEASRITSLLNSSASAAWVKYIARKIESLGGTSPLRCCRLPLLKIRTGGCVLKEKPKF